MEFTKEIIVNVNRDSSLFRELVLAKTAIYAIIIDRSNIKKDTYVSTVCSVVDFEMKIDASKLLTALNEYKEPESVELIFYPVGRKKIDVGDINDIENNPYQRLFSNFMAQSFICFFEKIRRTAEIKFGNNKYQWPDIMKFGWQIRNAFAHDGKINITKDNEIFNWKDVSFSKNDNGKQMIYNQLTTGDIVILMLEMDECLNQYV